MTGDTGASTGAGDIAVIAIFVLTYAGVAVGRIPGLRIDRPGIAVVGAVAMMAIRGRSIDEVAATAPWNTIALLLGMMIVIAQLRHGRALHRVANAIVDRGGSLAPLMFPVAGLAAVVTNDVVCLAIAPILCKTLPRRGVDPVPWLLGLAIAANLGSGLTVIGNPETILVGQRTRLDFVGYALGAMVPVLISLAIAHLLLGRLERVPTPPPPSSPEPDEKPLRPGEIAFGGVVLVVVVTLFAFDLPRGPIALGGAAVLMLNPTIPTRKLLRKVDWGLLLLVAGLGVVVEELRTTGVADRLLTTVVNAGVDPFAAPTLVAISAGSSAIVGGVPAILLLLGVIPKPGAEVATTLALSATFAGNLVVTASLANIIVVSVARRSGIEVSFLRHARIGIPVTLASLVVLAIWRTMVS